MHAPTVVPREAAATSEMSAASKMSAAPEVATAPGRGVSAPASCMLRPSQSRRSRYRRAEKQGAGGSHYISHARIGHSSSPLFSATEPFSGRWLLLSIRRLAATTVQARTDQNAVAPPVVDGCHKRARPLAGMGARGSLSSGKNARLIFIHEWLRRRARVKNTVLRAIAGVRVAVG